MLSQRDQQVLTRIENQLITGDPALVALFAELGDNPRTRSHSRRRAENLPYRLLVAGLMLLVLGAVTMSVSVTVIGISLAVLSLGAPYLRRPQASGAARDNRAADQTTAATGHPADPHPVQVVAHRAL